MPRRFLTCSLLLVAVLMLLISGCLPVELDVSSDGNVLIPRAEGFYTFNPQTGKGQKLFNAKQGQPAFGLFLPGGKQIVAIVQSEGGGMGVGFSVLLVNTDDGSFKKIHSASNITYASVSPDGKVLSFTRVGDESKVAGIDENLPELHTIELATGKVTHFAAAAGVNVLHRWFADSQSILAFQIAGKQQTDSGDVYLGKLIKADIATGKATPLLEVAGTKDTFIDLSPDGKHVLLTQRGTAAPGQPVKINEEGELKLSQLRVADGVVTDVAPAATYGFYSPDGANILVGRESEDSKNGLELLVGPTVDPATLKKLSDGVVKDAGTDMMNTVSVYPLWLDNATVLCIRKRPVFGTAAANFELTLVSLGGGEPRNLQTAIDAVIAGQ